MLEVEKTKNLPQEQGKAARQDPTGGLENVASKQLERAHEHKNGGRRDRLEVTHVWNTCQN